MPGEVVEFREDRSGGGLDHGRIRISAGERLDSFDRVPKRHGQEFGAPGCRALQEKGAAVAWNITQRRENRRRRVALIGIGIPCFRRTPP
ncbi:MAG TPA: hypothetical protein VGZ72_22190 [Stellaceae bacterium]|nr:hypothetical protein [Stellaceae bacterium]